MKLRIFAAALAVSGVVGITGVGIASAAPPRPRFGCIKVFVNETSTLLVPDSRRPDFRLCPGHHGMPT